MHENTDRAYQTGGEVSGEEQEYIQKMRTVLADQIVNGTLNNNREQIIDTGSASHSEYTGKDHVCKTERMMDDGLSR